MEIDLDRTYDAGFYVQVPTFPPATNAGTGPISILNPVLDGTAHYQFFLHEGIVHQLIADEVVFRQKASTWHERAWFITGSILRTEHDLVGVASGFVPAVDTNAGAGSVSFSPTTWASLHRSLHSGERCLGWLHTHSLTQLSDAGSESVTGPGESVDRRAMNEEPSGLFLSTLDLGAARNSFRAPLQVTAVMDSDAAMRLWQGEAVPLRRILAFFGWCGGMLQPRSVHVTTGAMPA